MVFSGQAIAIKGRGCMRRKALGLPPYLLYLLHSTLLDFSIMNRVAKIFNWLLVIFFGATGLLLAILQPSNPPLSILCILPYALTLVAIRSDSHRVSVWFAVVVSAIWGLFMFAGIFLSLSYAAMPVFPAVIFAVCATPCFLNIKVLIEHLHDSGSDGSLERISEGIADIER